MKNCYMCGGWCTIHPLDTGETWHNGKGERGPILVWAASRATYEPGSISCPACEGTGKALMPPTFKEGKPISIKERVW